MGRTELHIRIPATLHAILVADATRMGISLNALIATVLATEYRERHVSLVADENGTPNA